MIVFRLRSVESPDFQEHNIDSAEVGRDLQHRHEVHSVHAGDVRDPVRDADHRQLPNHRRAEAEHSNAKSALDREIQPIVSGRLF